MIDLVTLEQLAVSLTSTTAAILFGAALLEALLPWPVHLRLCALVGPLTQLGHKVYRPDGSARQQSRAGLLAVLVVWLPCAVGLWAMRNLAPSEPLFDLLFLLLLIESRPLRELAKTTRALASQETLILARLQAAPWLKRETSALSVMGVTKAVCESCTLRLVGQWAGPLLGFALAGIQGALLWRLAQLMNLAWSPKQPAFSQFGRAAAALHQALCAPAILLLALPLSLPQLHRLGAFLRGARQWPYPAMGALLALLSSSLGVRLGGPRYYQGTLTRLPVLEAPSDPTAATPLQLLNHLQLIGWSWLALAFLLTVLAADPWLS